MYIACLDLNKCIFNTELPKLTKTDATKTRTPSKSNCDIVVNVLKFRPGEPRVKCMLSHEKFYLYFCRPCFFQIYRIMYDPNYYTRLKKYELLLKSIFYEHNSKTSKIRFGFIRKLLLFKLF